MLEKVKTFIEEWQEVAETNAIQLFYNYRNCIVKLEGDKGSVTGRLLRHVGKNKLGILERGAGGDVVLFEYERVYIPVDKQKSIVQFKYDNIKVVQRWINTKGRNDEVTEEAVKDYALLINFINEVSRENLIPLSLKLNDECCFLIGSFIGCFEEYFNYKQK